MINKLSNNDRVEGVQNYHNKGSRSMHTMKIKLGMLYANGCVPEKEQHKG